MSCYLAYVRATQPERIESRIDRSGGPDACHPWTRHRTRQGYGSWHGIAVHRIVLAQSLGRAIRLGYYACHTCDNPPCCNPAHLFEGTHTDNMRDAARKGRTTGERNPAARLTDHQVREIRTLLPFQTQRAIAARFGVSQSQVGRIQEWHEGNRLMSPRREPRVPRFMAIPPGARQPRPDSAMRDALLVGFSVVVLAIVYLLAPILSAPVR